MIQVSSRECCHQAKGAARSCQCDIATGVSGRMEKAAVRGVGRSSSSQPSGLSCYSSAGIWPPVCAKFLLTMRQRPLMRDSVRKLTNDSVPQNPSSTTVALAASPA